MGKKMMILGGSVLQVPAIKAAKELGYEIILVDYDENATGFALADVKLVVSTLDKEEVYRQALIYRPDVVITSTSDGPVRTAAYVNEKLGKKPDLSYEDSLCATIKSHMRKRLEENHVPVPVYYVVENWAGFWEAVKALDGRCIVKPSDNAGSRGVTLLEGGEKTEEELRRVYDYSKGNSRNGIVLVEEFMSGAEVSVEAMTVNGKTEIISITDKYITQPPYFVEIAHSEPSRRNTREDTGSRPTGDPGDSAAERPFTYGNKSNRGRAESGGDRGKAGRGFYYFQAGAAVYRRGFGRSLGTAGGRGGAGSVCEMAAGGGDTFYSKREREAQAFGDRRGNLPHGWSGGSGSL